MIVSERAKNSYALRNALLLAAYGVFGILSLPRLWDHLEGITGGMVFVVRSGVLILYLCYIFIGTTAMMIPDKIKENHLSINLLFLVVFVDCMFLGFYLTSKNGFQTPANTALSLSSLIIAGIMLYYFTKFQIQGKEARALQKMSAMLLFFSGGGEIFFHHFPYINTILGWFMIWIALTTPTRPIWKSFIMSILGSALFFVPRAELVLLGFKDITLLDLLRTFIVENVIPPLYFMYVYFGLILLVVIIILKIKLRDNKVYSKPGTDTPDSSD
jgi:hypothetical protein